MLSLYMYCDAGECCEFPAEWRGKYFQSELGEVIITRTRMTTKGMCVHRTADYYLVISR